VANITKSDAGFLEQFEPDIFWEKHGRKVIAGIAVVVAVGIGLFLWQRHTTQEAERAGERLTEARDAGSLGKIIDDSPGQPVAAAAMIRLADAYFRDGKYAEAAGLHQKFLSEFPRHSLAPFARLGLAAIQEVQGNLPTAREQYIQLSSSDPSGSVTLAARMGAARCTEAMGQIREARQMYEEILPATQGSPWQTECFIRWTVLGRDLPPEPPQPAPTTSLPQLSVTPQPTPPPTSGPAAQ
jgi:tetratricopeptide (TPR) repeat protein